MTNTPAVFDDMSTHVTPQFASPAPPSSDAAATPRPQVIVRRTQPSDAAVFLSLVDALAEYEKLAPPDAAARERLIRDGFGPAANKFTPLLVEVLESNPVQSAPSAPADAARSTGVPGESQPGAAKAVGYAILVETYSSFRAQPTLYLEDLFILSEARGIGAGKALFQAVVEEADRRGCGRVEFVVLEWNQLARDFYHRLGARHLEDWCFYRLDAEQFQDVLNPAPK